MELVVCLLVAIIVILLVKTHNLSIRASKDQHDYQAKINLLIQEISGLKDTLAESERELDFYKNIEVASGELNVPAITDQNEDAELDSEQADIFHEMEYTHDNLFITGKAGTGKSFLLNKFKKMTRKSYIVLAF